ncbi:vWA domain-containing protein [Methylovulum psychrotolerans]|nr:VWA domain-containing protein [Methylovulum psychrotolerans]
MTVIIRGQRTGLASLLGSDRQTGGFQIGLKMSGKVGVDFACFGLGKGRKLFEDAYMTFYNQPETPCGGVGLSAAGGDGDQARFTCRLPNLPDGIESLVFTAAIDGKGSMRQIQQGYLRFLVSGLEIARFAFTGGDFQDEKALMLGEIYRKDGVWRFSAIGQGFNGGMAALVEYFGAAVAEGEPLAKGKLSLENKMAASSPALVCLAKKAAISLEKHKLAETVARVGLVLDASGSMRHQYRDGKVQSVINRLLPLAVHFDDDGELDVWAFSDHVLALPSATLKNHADYVGTVHQGWQKWGMMGKNNEPPAIEKVIAHYRDTRLPVLVIFVSDGGVNQNAAIKKLLVAAAPLPIFWQFVGIGGRNYGVLEKFDTMEGRVIDNCGFFALDDLDVISEQELYDRLLKEFPNWICEAQQKRIIRTG